MSKKGISPSPPPFPAISTTRTAAVASTEKPRRKPRTTAVPPTPASEPGVRVRTPRGPSPQKTEATRQSIIDAAFAEFLEHGYARGTTVSVAQRAGLSKVTLFRYFESKEALFEAVIQHHIASAALALQASPMRDGESVGAFLLRTVAPAMDVLDSSGRSATARLVMAEGLEFPLLAQMYRRHAHEPLLTRIRALVELAHARGELRHPGVLEHPELLLGPLWLAMMNNTVLHPEVPLDAGALFRLQVQLVLQVPELPERAPSTPTAKPRRPRKS